MGIAERIRAARAAEIIKAETAKEAVEKRGKEKQEALQQMVRKFNDQIRSGLSPIVQVTEEASIEDLLRKISTVVPDLKTQLSIHTDYSYHGNKFYGKRWHGLDQEEAEVERSRLVPLSLKINRIEEITADFDFLTKDLPYVFTEPKELGYSVFVDPRYQDHAFNRPRLRYELDWDRQHDSSGSSMWNFMSINIQHRRHMQEVEIILAGGKKFDSLHINNPREWRDRLKFEDTLFGVFQQYPGRGYIPWSEPEDPLSAACPHL